MDAFVFMQQHWLLLLVFLTATVFLVLYHEDRSFLIAPTDVMQAISDGACLIDVRPENTRTHHIYGAQMHPFEDEVITLPLTIAKTQPIILYCDAMGFAPKARKILLQKGYSNVKVIEHGLSAWIADGLPIVTHESGDHT